MHSLGARVISLQDISLCILTISERIDVSGLVPMRRACYQCVAIFNIEAAGITRIPICELFSRHWSEGDSYGVVPFVGSHHPVEKV